MPARTGSVPRSPPPVSTPATRPATTAAPATNTAPTSTRPAAPAGIATDGFSSNTVPRDEAASQIDDFYGQLKNVVDAKSENGSSMRETMGDEKMNQMLADAKAKCEALKGQDLTPQQLQSELKKVQYRVKTDVMFEKMAASQFQADMLAITQKAKDKYKSDG